MSRAPWYQPFTPPHIEARIWEDAMNKAAWQCECAGQCGRPHLKTAGRCGVVHSTAQRLAVVTADPLATLTGTDLVALCAACETGIRRAAKTAQTNESIDQPSLFDQGVEAA
ncbi:hypothetical protein ACI2LF_43830 [Kribbella sp. NPDC020789]